MGTASLSINNPIISISFSRMNAAKRKVDRAQEEARYEDENLSRAIGSLHVSDGRLRMKAEALNSMRSRINSRKGNLQRIATHIDYTIRRFQETDNSCAQRIKTNGYECRKIVGISTIGGIFGDIIDGIMSIIDKGKAAWDRFTKYLGNSARKKYSFACKKTNKKVVDTTSNEIIDTVVVKRYFAAANRSRSSIDIGAETAKKAIKKAIEEIKIKIYKDGDVLEVTTQQAYYYCTYGGWSKEPPEATSKGTGNLTYSDDFAAQLGAMSISDHDKEKLLDLDLVNLLARIIYAEQTNPNDYAQNAVAWTMINRILSGNHGEFSDLVKNGKVVEKRELNIFNMLIRPKAYTCIDGEGGNWQAYTAKSKDDAGWKNSVKVAINMVNVLEKDNDNRDKAGDRAALEKTIYNPIGKGCWYFATGTFNKNYDSKTGTVNGHKIDVSSIKPFHGNTFFNYDYIKN